MLRKPLRVRLNKAAKWGAQEREFRAEVWTVEPVDRTPEATYRLEIAYNGFFIIDATPHGSVEWVAWKDGDRYHFVPDEGYEELLREEAERRYHEINLSDEAVARELRRARAEAEAHVLKRSIFPARAMGPLGFDSSIFPRLEDAWRAILQFTDLGYTE